MTPTSNNTTAEPAPVDHRPSVGSKAILSRLNSITRIDRVTRAFGPPIVLLAWFWVIFWTVALIDHERLKRTNAATYTETPIADQSTAQSKDRSASNTPHEASIPPAPERTTALAFVPEDATNDVLAAVRAQTLLTTWVFAQAFEQYGGRKAYDGISLERLYANASAEQKAALFRERANAPLTRNAWGGVTTIAPGKDSRSFTLMMSHVPPSDCYVFVDANHMNARVVTVNGTVVATSKNVDHQALTTACGASRQNLLALTVQAS